jgi:hypothetical protein
MGKEFFKEMSILILVVIFAICVANWSVGCCHSDTNNEMDSQTKLEQAYFEGQKDCLNGDIRIKKDFREQYWEWTKSPWNNGRPPKFVPSNPIYRELFNVNNK